jgi:hypothetical protein
VFAVAFGSLGVFCHPVYATHSSVLGRRVACACGRVEAYLGSLSRASRHLCFYFPMACLTGPPWPRQASATIAAAGLPALLAGEACMCHALRACVWDERLVRASIVMLAWDTHVGASMDIHVHPSSLLWLMWALGCLGVSWLAFLLLHGNVPLCWGHSASYPWQVSGLARAVQACWGVAGWLQNTGSCGQMVGQEAAGEAIGFEEVQACTQQGCAARGVRGVVLPRSNS